VRVREDRTGRTAIARLRLAGGHRGRLAGVTCFEETLPAGNAPLGRKAPGGRRRADRGLRRDRATCRCGRSRRRRCGCGLGRRACSEGGKARRRGRRRRRRGADEPDACLGRPARARAAVFTRYWAAREGAGAPRANVARRGALLPHQGHALPVASGDQQGAAGESGESGASPAAELRPRVTLTVRVRSRWRPRPRRVGRADGLSARGAWVGPRGSAPLAMTWRPKRVSRPGT